MRFEFDTSLELPMKKQSLAQKSKLDDMESLHAGLLVDYKEILKEFQLILENLKAIFNDIKDDLREIKGI